MPDPKVEYRLLGPGTFDDEAKDFRHGYAIERVERTIIGEFDTRDDAREHMLATTDERRKEASR